LSIEAGVAVGSANATGTDQTVTISLIAGSAMGSVAGDALGSTIVVQTALIPGVASGGAFVEGTDQTVTITLDAGDATGTGAGEAPGALLVVNAQIVAGVASGETGTVRRVGGAALTRTPHIAPGALLTVNVSLIPGQARVGHDIVVKQADGTERIITVFGATDEELCDDDFMMALVTGDWDLWLLKQHEEAT
jgi:hypothetical protein